MNVVRVLYYCYAVDVYNDIGSFTFPPIKMTENMSTDQTIDDLFGVITSMFASLSGEKRESSTQVATPLVTSFIDIGGLTVTLTTDGNNRQLEGVEAAKYLIAGMTGQHDTQTNKDDVIDGVGDID